VSDPRPLLFISGIVLLAYWPVLAFLAVWATRGRLPKSYRAKYSRRIVRLSQLPFTEQWRASIDPIDLPVFLRARTRGHVFFLAMVVFTILLLVFLVFHAVVALWRCRMDAIGAIH